jgi:hypothetical protein
LICGDKSWLNEAPWFFAPFHYGRWACVKVETGLDAGPIGNRVLAPGGKIRIVMPDQKPLLALFDQLTVPLCRMEAHLPELQSGVPYDRE